jgi:hypothetical protein
MNQEIKKERKKKERGGEIIEAQQEQSNEKIKLKIIR